jgi:AraC family transcriptional activator of pobA
MDRPRIFWYFSDMFQIDNYNLYGETGDLPDVLHCETIQARSTQHDGEFSPHRHARLHQFLLLDHGNAQAHIESRKSTLSPGTLLNLPAGCVHGFSFAPNCQGWVVTLTSELLEQNLHGAAPLRPLLETPAQTASNADIRRVITEIFAEYPNQGFARAQILRSLSGLLAGLVARALSREQRPNGSTSTPLRQRFENLLEEHYRAQWSVADYAAALAVSPTHLSRVMRAATGQGTRAAIEARLMREARRNLAYSNLTIAEIAYQLGFTDPSYFTRVFTRTTGHSPRSFRKRLAT